jgi:monofunctional glycosyltransferase
LAGDHGGEAAVKALRITLWVLGGTLALVLCALTAIYFIAKAVLAPLPGEWAVPLRAGPLQMQAGVPSLIRLATSPWAGPLLNGRSVSTRAGRIQATWQAADQTLALRCAPCHVRAPRLGDDALALSDVQITVRRNAGRLDGALASGAVRAKWQGDLSQRQISLHIQLPMTPIADGYALFSAAIPEVAQARIDGRFALQASLTLPGGKLTVTPQVESFQVSGLGTEAFATARSACSPRASKLTTDSWLARAVIAAEDQRFYEHGGFDLTEISAALSSPPDDAKAAARGASTLPQQLAKLLVTGDERSPVRKLRELLYAVEMEQTLGKPRMLQLYLAHVPWGPNVCGAEAASRHYFNRPAHQLSPTQAAWLAAMLHNPTLEAARWRDTGQINVARTQWVLRGMRPLPRAERNRLADEVPQLKWVAPAAPRSPTATLLN